MDGNIEPAQPDEGQRELLLGEVWGGTTRESIRPMDLSAYRFAGFFLTRKFARPPHNSVRLLPPELLSLSPCMAHFLPDTWCISWTSDRPDDRNEAAEVFSLSPQELPSLMARVDAGFEELFGYPNVIRSQAGLEYFAQSVRSDCVVLGAALHESHAADFLKEQQSNYGVSRILAGNHRIPSGGRILGYEPFGFDAGPGCSWLCNGLEEVCARDLSIFPNSYGFIDTESEAIRCLAHIYSDAVGAEPIQWLPWLILEYNL